MFKLLLYFVCFITSFTSHHITGFCLLQQPATKPVSGAAMPAPTQVPLPVSSFESSRVQTASVDSAATDPKKELQESATETELNDGETDDNDEYGYEEDDEEEDEDDEEEAGFGDEYEYPQDEGTVTAGETFFFFKLFAYVGSSGI